jgi:hypothetical protein
MIFKLRVHVDGDLRRGNREREFEVEGGRRFDRGVARVIRHERGEERISLPRLAAPLLCGKGWLFGCFRW